MTLNGIVWKLGDGIGATDIVSAKYDKQGMSRQWEECARHLLEEIDPTILPAINPGDILIAGQDFGRGHAHYYMTAVMACKAAGIAGIIADGVNVLFQRAAIDQGLTVWQVPGISAFVETGDRLDIDLAGGIARRTGNEKASEALVFKPVSPLILDIVDADGSNNWALRRIGAIHATA